MKFNKAYIVSWQGKSNRHLERRQKFFKTQIEWLLQNNIQPIVYAQEFSPEDYIPGPIYIDHVGPVIYVDDARNKLLPDFYNSDDDFAMFIDDDSVFYTGDEKYADGDLFLKNLKELDIEKLSLVDLFFPICPAQEPFTEFTLTNKSMLKNNLYFERSMRLKGSMFFLKNIKKHHGKEIYFDDSKHYKDGKFVGGTDNFFAYNLVSQGMNCYKSKNIVLKEMGANYSTWTKSDGNGSEDRQGYTEVLDELVSKYFKVERKNFIKKYFTGPRTLTIPKYGVSVNSLEDLF